jgi:hypothetical protein
VFLEEPPGCFSRGLFPLALFERKVINMGNVGVVQSFPIGDA